MGQTILLIDDEKILRDVVVDRLTKDGFKVIQAANGTEGFRKAIDEQPDLILLDNRMPEMGGYQMLTQLRAHNNWGANVPVIFFTNVALTAEAEADIADTKPAHYLVKSDTSLDQVVTKIRDLIGS